MTLKPVTDGSRLERKKEETKQKILTVAMPLFMKHGVDAITMEQIAEEADLAKGTLYNYFPVKEAIIDEYIQRSFIQRSSERLERIRRMPDTRARMIQTLSDLMQGVQAQKDIFEKYFTYRIRNMISLNQSESAQSGLYLLETEIITLGQKNAEIRTDLPLDILTGLFEFAFVNVAQQFYKEPGKFKPRKVIEQCVDLFMNGVRA
ncbi:MAG TPA: TetR/AcrR family transcriptional regulator [Anaerolineales bacterium]|nr:TetR/AcrR family transcriptional regulator [Anaerolineales bacterium]